MSAETRKPKERRPDWGLLMFIIPLVAVSVPSMSNTISFIYPDRRNRQATSYSNAPDHANTFRRRPSI